MKSRKYLKFALAAGILSVSALAQAHDHFFAPQSYIINGLRVGIIGGYSRTPLYPDNDLEGYDIIATIPSGENQNLEAKNSASLIVANVDTKENGTYKVLATKDVVMEYAQIGDLWLRIKDSQKTDLPPFSERDFIKPSELAPEMRRIQSLRHEYLVTYFSKSIVTDSVLKASPRGLDVQFSAHPNTLKSSQPVGISVSLDGKRQPEFSVIAWKQITALGEKQIDIRRTTDRNGDVELTFPMPGQYLIKISSPEVKSTRIRPANDSYLYYVSVYVN